MSLEPMRDASGVRRLLASPLLIASPQASEDPSLEY